VALVHRALRQVREPPRGGEDRVGDAVVDVDGLDDADLRAQVDVGVQRRGDVEDLSVSFESKSSSRLISVSFTSPRA
jgi:hypothetical protein